ncbi:MAG: tripartite tricarboxylate transporter substrate binding protein [Betaproteobacteria bacterium]|nr:tripartite tricarboxylate transporter substrate binding protein [Betaproteobacteria bacterium]
MVKRLLHFLCPAALMVCSAAHAAAPAGGPDYPSRPLRVIVPWVVGGGTDIVARIITPKLTEALGQQVLIDNRPGANGIIGSEIAAPSFPASSVKELAALAKSKPGELNFGSWGEGSLAHLSGELFKNSAGLKMTHVPYKGAPQAIIDMLGGRLPLMFTTMPTGAPQVKQGKLRALAVTNREREPLLPEVPTMIESGYPGFEVDSWRGLYVPAGTPKAIITRLNRELVKVLQMPDVKERIVAAGFAPVSGTPEGLDAFGKAELTKWSKVAKSAGVRIK